MANGLDWGYDLQQLKLVGNTGKRPFPVVRHIYDVYGNSNEAEVGP